MIYPTTELPRLSTEEEAALILSDIFGDDKDAEDVALLELSIEYSTETQDELNEVIVENETAIYERYLPAQD
jgi:hypothetical protein